MSKVCVILKDPEMHLHVTNIKILKAIHKNTICMSVKYFFSSFNKHSLCVHKNKERWVLSVV